MLKLLAIMLYLISSLTSVTIASASSVGDNSDVQYSCEYYEQCNMPILASSAEEEFPNLEVTSYSNVITMSSNPPVQLYQHDPKWDVASIGGWTFGTTGCVPTSIAMVAQGYGISTSPLEYGYMLNRVGLFNYGNLLGGNADSVMWAINQTGLTPMLMYSSNDIAHQLMRGSSIIALVGPPTLSPSGYDHAIVTYGYRSEGEFGPETQIFDPLGRVNGWLPIQFIWDSHSTSPYDYGSQDTVIVAVNSSVFDVPNPIDGQNWMYRLYNPNSGEHFYTANLHEANQLVSHSWTYEGVGWAAPIIGQSVYRLYNSNAGDHHYTMNSSERDNLVDNGWTYEGVGWRSGGNQPLYRQYNPNAETGTHNYTTATGERDFLLSLGWQDEQVGWWGM